MKEWFKYKTDSFLDVQKKSGWISDLKPGWSVEKKSKEPKTIIKRRNLKGGR